MKYLREQTNLTQEQLAEKADISLDYLGKIEVSINKPGLKTVFKIARALKIRVKDLFDF
ncbi:MAG: helix-turn-helix transcriptional regulator [Heliobacteriaceae bacterium]|nr:helix-turn-helix transcriptional regulator [Heliobacteriaceae bacterium]